MTPIPCADDSTLWDRQEHARNNPEDYCWRIPAGLPTSILAVLNGCAESRDDTRIFVARQPSTARALLLAHNERWFATHDDEGAGE